MTSTIETDSCTRTALPASRRSARRPSRDDASDEQLGRRYAAGGATVIRELYDRYATSMLAAALSVVGGDRRLAEEAVQSAMVKAWRSRGAYDPGRPLAPWLFTIVRRSAIDIRRREHRHRPLARPEPSSRTEPSTPDGADAAARAWAVRDGLLLLPVKERTVIRLAYVDGFSQGEIAAHLAIPIGTVKSRTASAHQRLRTQLAPSLAAA
jgi:RNA polymerase sigma-70 factor (ECF subfamily)